MTTSTHVRHTRCSASEVVAGVGVLGVGVAIAMNPAGIEHGPILCPFRLATGLPCPGCGLTRSWVYGVHGEWAQSFAAHPFGVPLLSAVVVLAITVIVCRVRRRPPPALERLLWNPVSKIVMLAWLVFAVVRIILAI